MANVQLKTYQLKTLDTLKAYLTTARFQGAQAAYETAEKPGVVNLKPYKPLDGLAAVPFVCLRLPTGGGKTLLSAHTVRIASETYIERDFPLVLWLVPSNTIRQQTLETLKTPGNANYEALRAAFDGNFMVLDITDFALIRPHDLTSKAVVVVGTQQTLKVNNTDGRKVYAHNENLEPHFSKVPSNAPGLEKIDSGDHQGKIRFSFANLMHLHRPLVIVDEAHNNSTGLSFEVFQRINASCVIEFTATPADNSNILHRVSATELKAEEMIKLPIVLTEHATWEEAVRDSILTRERLAQLARTDANYLRPIILFQAENQAQDITWQILKEHLITNENIPENKIAVVTGEQRELDGINLFDPNCPIDYIITVQALKEGWDCSFAYVFCSVANINSAKDVEQILGRVLRMPYAKRRGHHELNRAYAHVSSTSWPNAIKQLHDNLVHMGFEKEEADNSLETGQPTLPFSPTGNIIQEPPSLVLTLQQAATFADADKHAVVLEHKDGVLIAKVTGLLSPEAQEAILSAVSPENKETATVQLNTHQATIQRAIAPVTRGEKFVIPQLCLYLHGELTLPETDTFLDAAQWTLTGPASLTANEFSLNEDGKTFEIDIQDGHIHESFVSTSEQMNLDLVDTGWTDLQLSRWLDKRLCQPDVSQPVLLEFIRRTIAFILDERHIPVSALMRGRFLLEKVLQGKIKSLREAARRQGYQTSLFAQNAPVEVSFEYGLAFGPSTYEPRSFYPGRPYVFRNHFYPQVGEPKNIGEEFECAKLLDMHPKVKFWVRNIERSQHSFRLPTSTDYFYPDFVAKLTDDRILVVEYKGEFLRGTPDTEEKISIGALWASKSKGKGLFLKAWKKDDKDRPLSQQISDTIAC